MDSKQQFRSGKPATQSLHQIAANIAAMRAAIFHAVLMAAPISLAAPPPPREPHAGIDTCFCRQTAHRRRQHGPRAARVLPQRWRNVDQEHLDLAGAGRRLHGADLVLGLQSRPAVVAQARYRHRSLLLVLHPGDRALLAHRHAHRRRRAVVRHHHGRRLDRLLRQRPRAARRAADRRADGAVPGRRRFHSVLDAPRLPRRENVEVPRRASLLRGAGMDLGGALPSGQPVPRQRVRRCRRCCLPASRRTSFWCSGL